MSTLTEPPKTSTQDRFIDWPPDRVSDLKNLLAWLANRPPSEIFQVIHEITKIHQP